MAINWLTVLQSVPWSEVIGNAPKVAEGAKRLWDAVARKQDIAASHSATGTSTSPNSSDTAALDQRLASLEASVRELHAQMLTSSELVKELADQNSQLIARIELNRRRTTRMAIALALSLVFSLVCLAYVLLRSAI